MNFAYIYFTWTLVDSYFIGISLFLCTCSTTPAKTNTKFNMNLLDKEITQQLSIKRTAPTMVMSMSNSDLQKL